MKQPAIEPVRHALCALLFACFIAATTRLTPALGELPNDRSVSCAFGCHGNGVAFMTWAGRELARRIEPRAPTPDSRLRAVRRLTDAGIDVDFRIEELGLCHIRKGTRVELKETAVDGARVAVDRPGKKAALGISQGESQRG